MDDMTTVPTKHGLNALLLIVLVLGVGIGVGGYSWWQQAQPETTPTSTSIPSGWKTSASNQTFSFGYPTNANLVSSNTFTFEGLTYSVEMPAAAGHVTIENWLADENASATNTDLSKYTKTTMNGKTAYTFTGELRTYVMMSGNVYVLVARDGIAPSVDVSDVTYAQFLASFNAK